MLKFQTETPPEVIAADRARLIVAEVVDPEIPDLTIEDLGILRDVTVSRVTGRVTVEITPTYSGCPAIDVIRSSISDALAAGGFPSSEVTLQMFPEWTTDAITERGRAKLNLAGIAAPGARIKPGSYRPGRVAVVITVRCPQCGSPDTQQVSRFGSTACKALWKCRSCAEPFDQMKAL
jgi:ring-1,2-phenylacetyl-CoA epoxidase subunit PaaD